MCVAFVTNSCGHRIDLGMIHVKYFVYRLAEAGVEWLIPDSLHQPNQMQTTLIFRFELHHACRYIPVGINY